MGDSANSVLVWFIHVCFFISFFLLFLERKLFTGLFFKRIHLTSLISVESWETQRIKLRASLVYTCVLLLPFFLFFFLGGKWFTIFFFTESILRLLFLLSRGRLSELNSVQVCFVHVCRFFSFLFFFFFLVKDRAARNSTRCGYRYSTEPRNAK